MHPYDQLKSEAGQHKPNRPDEPITNISQFDAERSIPGCTVITFDGVPGFIWIGPDGVRRNAGVRYPTMRIVADATVHILYDEETGKHSAGWTRGGDTE